MFVLNPSTSLHYYNPFISVFTASLTAVAKLPHQTWNGVASLLHCCTHHPFGWTKCLLSQIFKIFILQFRGLASIYPHTGFCVFMHSWVTWLQWAVRVYQGPTGFCQSSADVAAGHFRMEVMAVLGFLGQLLGLQSSTMSFPLCFCRRANIWQHLSAANFLPDRTGWCTMTSMCLVAVFTVAMG